MGNTVSSLESWSVKKSTALYNVPGWSADFFGINESGRVTVTPKGPNGPKLDLYELVNDLVDRGLRAPLWIRFPDIVETRVRMLADCFTNAFKSFDYKGRYKGVYPIKVNQQRHLVEAMVKVGAETGLGLEAGSKPELLVALALLDNPEALLVCNGFKDREYIETALLSTRLGRNIITVIDRFQELPLLLGIAKELDIKPRIGFRAKLENKGGMNTSGSVPEELSKRVMNLLEKAIENAKNDGRKTVMDRDVPTNL